MTGLDQVERREVRDRTQEPITQLLPDGRRLHLQHGPIDLIIEAFGREEERRAACEQASVRFGTVLAELVSELAMLRRPSHLAHVTGSIACRMLSAVRPHEPRFITPMAAVAGAVAEEVLAAMIADRTLERAYVNNGGDIALHLLPGESFEIAIASGAAGLPDRITIRHSDPVRGIATSGWRGRSHSLGIADAVTVLARTASEADAAATLIANAVDLPGHPAVKRLPARELSPDSDLGDRLVTVDVRPLSRHDVTAALNSGLAAAESMRARGLVAAAALFLQGAVRDCDPADYLAPTLNGEKFVSRS
jgi:hypothetical protein